MASTARNPVTENHDLNWWLKLAISLVTVVAAILAVGTALNARPTEDKVHTYVQDSMKAHAEGSPPHLEMREIINALQKLQIDVAVIKAAVVKSDLAADEAARAAARALANKREP